MNTPRTDAVYPPHIIDLEFSEQGRSFGWGTLHDMRECSRKLETELAQAEKKIQYYEKLNSDRCNMERAVKHMQDQLAAVQSLATDLADALSSCTEQEWFKLGKSGKVTVTLDANKVRHVLATYGKKGNES